MKLTDEVQQRILDALATRLPNKQLGACSICQQTSWKLNYLYPIILTTEEPKSLSLGPTNIPSVALYCTNCGNVHFLSLFILGLKDLMEPEKPTAKESEAAKK